MIAKSKWITAGKGVNAPCIIKNFSIEDVANAKLYITGLGYFKCKINGQDLSNDKFMPVFSDYRKRDFSSLLYPVRQKEFIHRVYYLDFDVANLLQNGENIIEITLGNGWYNQNRRTVEGKLSFGQALITRFALDIQFKDGSNQTIFSDGSEKYCQSKIVNDNIFYGETQDLRIIDRPKIYKNVQIEEDFETQFTLQTCPNDAVIRQIIPIKVYQKDNVSIYDAGENVTGWAKITVNGKKDENVIVTYAGNYQNGQIDTFSSGAYMKNDRDENQLQQDRYILDGKKRRVCPEFCRYCFRYFEIEGNVDEVVVEVVHTKNTPNSTFESSNQVLNWLHSAFVRTELNNMHDGFVSDCPHRERLGYTGDGQITALSSMLTIDAKEFYHKWIQDIADGQDQTTGNVNNTAPFMGGGGGPGGWGGAIVFIPMAFYQRYGDISMAKKYFSNMEKWIEYMQSRTENNLVVKSEDGCWCLGDWAFVGGEKLLPEAFVNTFFLVKGLQCMQIFAKALNLSNKIETFVQKEEKYKMAIIDSFYNPLTGSFCASVQGADAFAIEIGIGDERTEENLAKKYSVASAYDTGFFGTYFLTKVLLEKGYKDIAYNLLTSKEEGSFGFMLKNGATTINEHLDMGRYVSDCHPMFGAVCHLLFTHILGLSPYYNGIEYVIKPIIPTSLKNAKGSIVVNGKNIIAGFIKKEDKVFYNVIIPNGFNAKLCYNNKVYKLEQGENFIEI